MFHRKRFKKYISDKNFKPCRFIQGGRNEVRGEGGGGGGERLVFGTVMVAVSAVMFAS